jgi:hypothetical protein
MFRYRNLPAKLKAGLIWGVNNTDAQWFVKVDDDTVRTHPLHASFGSVSIARRASAQRYTSQLVASYILVD